LQLQRLTTLADAAAPKRAPMPSAKRPPNIAATIAAIPPASGQEYDFFADADPAAEPSDRWAVAGQFTPTYSYRNLTNMPANMSRADFDNAERPLVAYSGGVNVSYRAVKRFSVQMGVYYTQMGQTVDAVVSSYNMYAAISSNNTYSKNFLRTSSGAAAVSSNLKTVNNTNYDTYFNDTQMSNSAGVTPSLAASSSGYTLVERYDYIEIPMLARYRLVDRKFGLTVMGGMSTNFLIGNNVFVDNGNERIREGSVLRTRPVNYNSTVGLGLNYRVGNSLYLGIEPVFKYYLQSYTSDNVIGSHPYAFGLYTGVYYSF
jgi:hypothetical protein